MCIARKKCKVVWDAKWEKGADGRCYSRQEVTLLLFLKSLLRMGNTDSAMVIFSTSCTFIDEFFGWNIFWTKHNIYPFLQCFRNRFYINNFPLTFIRIILSSGLPPYDARSVDDRASHFQTISYLSPVIYLISYSFHLNVIQFKGSKCELMMIRIHWRA